MSVAAKKRAKALRVRYGVQNTLRQARPGETCRDRDYHSGKPQPECGAPAKMVDDGEGICAHHWARRCAPRRR